MKKDIEWLKEKIGELPCTDTVFISDDLGYMDSAVPVLPVYDLINQLDEPIEDPLATKIEERNHKQSIQDRLPEELEYLRAGESHDPIKPKHYRKGEIDLYESWYRTYPFNEFRAIMSAIAERYMKRDKNNRIEDLNKAIYTLSRLKEYEELEEEE